MKRIYIVAYLVLVMQGLFFTSCRKEHEYKKYFGDGEILYAGRADTVIVHPGDERMLLSVVLGNDPLVTKVKAFWNDGKDSIVKAVTPEMIKSTVDLMIEDLAEGTYNFTVFTYDNKNNPSVVRYVSGTVYGSVYSSNLVNRRLKGITYNTDGSMVNISWAHGNPDEVGIELLYTDKDGNSKTRMIPQKEVLTGLSEYDGNTKLKYRTIFKPDPNAIDTYTMDYVEVGLPVFERTLDKSKFNVHILPTDATTAHGWVMPNMWKDDGGASSFATINGTLQWFTFDTGVSTSITRFKTWQASDRLYNQENLKRFEIWGSNAPAADGSWASWTKLGTFESKKPSGSPVGTNTAGDVAYANAGEDFSLPPGSPKVRYIRIKGLEIWGSGNFTVLGEITLWTSDR
ncbi:DUF4998 domain-containing protein [Pedobacter nyackensis]|uniref:DUF4998 domain-containing protein n=1 Tax=Pedobacter nyackensis TaxID=475255 RepID=UPI0029300971|nr:DUF4998 domain-containing protein [Pedobacter nyackensis]